MPYQPFDTGWIKSVYSVICLGWFLTSTGLLPRFTMYSLYNNVYIPFSKMMSTLCDNVGNCDISTGIRIIRYESIIFGHVDYIGPIYSAIKYVESFIPSFKYSAPSSLHYRQPNISRRKTSTGRHLAYFYARKRILRNKQVVSGSMQQSNDFCDSTNQNRKNESNSAVLNLVYILNLVVSDSCAQRPLSHLL